MMFWKAFILSAGLCALFGQNGAVPLESVTVEGTDLPKPTVEQIAGLRIGAPIDRPGIEKACKNLQESGLFSSVGFKYAPGPKRGYALTLTLSDQAPLVAGSIDIPRVDENEVWRWLTVKYPRFDRRVPGDASAQEWIAREIEARFKTGHIVTKMETDFALHRNIISFQPEVLPSITAMKFTGMDEFSSDELSRILQKVIGGDGFTYRSFRNYVELNLRPAYEDHGMYRVQFPDLKAEFVGDTSVAVTTTIIEGPKYKLGAVDFIGDALPVDALRAAGRFHAGAVANWSEIQKGIWDTESRLKRTGYYEAKAQPERILHDDSRVLDLRLAYIKGPLYHFGELRVKGLTPQLEAKARQVWKAKPGDAYDFGYRNEFLQDFSRVVDFRQFKTYNVEADLVPSEHVMNITVSFQPR